MEEKGTVNPRPFLTFCLGEEIFALEIFKVCEVLELCHITKIPQTPGYMSGVINLRGGVVSVVDLRLKFGMQKLEATVDTSIIILELTARNELMNVGIIVDSVKEVIELDSSQIESAPRLGMNVSNEFIQGIGKKENAFLIILDIDKIFSAAELMDIGRIKKEASITAET